MSVLDGFEVFVAVCDEGSIAGAGRRLGAPRATLSRQLARLEAELGVRLLHRSTRRLVRTPAGDELYQRARIVVDAAVEAREAVRRLDDVPRGLLRVSVPSEVAAPFSELVFRYLDRYPEVSVEVVGTARHVDLVGEGFDVAIRAGEVRDTSLIGRRLIRSHVHVFGVADYFDRYGIPESPGDLERHVCVRAYREGVGPVTHWPLVAGGVVEVGGRLSSNGLSMSLGAVRRGVGLALLPAFESFRQGGFVPVLKGIVGTQSTVTIVYPERATQQPKVRAFVDMALEFLPDYLRVSDYINEA